MPDRPQSPCPDCGHQPDTPNHVHGCQSGRTLSPMHWTAGTAPEGTVKCPGICPRFTSKGSDYCCSGCRVQSEDGNEPGVRAAGDHPFLSHSEGCDERDQQRRPHAWQAS